MSAFLVEPQHIAEIVKWANKKGKVNYAYNCTTKEQIIVSQRIWLSC